MANVSNYGAAVQTAWKSPAGLPAEHGEIRKIILSLYPLWKDGNTTAIKANLYLHMSQLVKATFGA